MMLAGAALSGKSRTIMPSERLPEKERTKGHPNDLVHLAAVEPTTAERQLNMIGNYSKDEIWELKAHFDWLDKDRVGSLSFKLATRSYMELTFNDDVMFHLHDRNNPQGKPNVSLKTVIQCVFNNASEEDHAKMLDLVTPQPVIQEQLMELRDVFDAMDPLCTGYVDTDKILLEARRMFPSQYTYMENLAKTHFGQQKTQLLGKVIHFEYLLDYLFKFSYGKKAMEQLHEGCRPSKALTVTQLEQLEQLYAMYDTNGFEYFTEEDALRAFDRFAFSLDRRKFLLGVFHDIMKDGHTDRVSRRAFFDWYRLFTGNQVGELLKIANRRSGHG